MRWAAAHVDISPLALPSPEHELTDPMRGVTAAIPGSHPLPTSPGGMRRTQRLSGFWEGTTDIDDSALNHTPSKMPFATSAGTAESSSGSTDADDAADTDHQSLQSSSEESLKPNASLSHEFVLHPASAPVLDARQERSLVKTDYFGDVNDVFPPEHESHTLSTSNGIPRPPSPPALHRNDDSLFDHGPSSVPVASRPAKLTRPGSSPLPDSSSLPRPLLGEGRIRSESMASLKHQRALKEERRFNELQYLSPPYSADEPDRRRALYKFNLWNTGPDTNFDRIAHLVKLVFSTKCVIISLIDEKEHCQRAHSFCAHAILQRGDEPMVVLDALKDWRFAKNPLTTGAPFVRFYAGAPLRTQDGFNIGTLAIIDDQPREEFSPRQRHTLKEFAAIAMREMELWRDKIQLRVRDRIQNSMEQFSRECLEIDEEVYDRQIYDRAAKLVKRTLDVEGVIVPEKSRTRANLYRTAPWRPREEQTSVPLTMTEYKELNAFFEEFPQGKISEGIIPQSFRPFLPVHIQYALTSFALLCAYNTQNHQQRFLEGHELSYLRAIGVIILSAVLKKRMLEGDKAKNFSFRSASISHELRTPLHGVNLGGCRAPQDSNLNHPQTSLMQTVKACGTSLIETVNHLVEEAVDGCWIGHHAWVKNSEDSVIGSVYCPPKGEQGLPIANRVETVINIVHRPEGWLLKCEKGGIRRVLMNLFGNSLKFTSSGYIHIVLQEAPPKESDPPDKVMVELIVCDTGKGIGQKFLKNQLFQPFSQENPLQTGTGLGLAIEEGVGTKIKITFPAEVPPDPAASRPALEHSRITQYLLLVGLQDVDEGDIVILNEDPTPIALAIQENDTKRCFILLSSAHGNTTIMATASDMTKWPGGPSRLHAVLKQSIDYLFPKAPSPRQPSPPPVTHSVHILPEISALDSLGGTLLKSSLGSLEGIPHFRVLIVEDNSLLRDLLIKWLVKKKYDYSFAVNGREGVEKFQNDGPFSVILLDMSMPVLDGIGATKEIRQIEANLAKNSPGFRSTKLLALTGMSSLEDKRRAFLAGVDGYIVKPFSFLTLDEMFHKLGVLLPTSPHC
ncbi:hypothetical protein BJ912DRAFT_1020221 [Pholiota molesta]|nr:hypothetical protein BJ912DRAFT_1020221 [Pholiota molesta]